MINESSAMRPLEVFTAPKNSSADSEDVYVCTDDFAAVVDGATDKSGKLWDGKTGGRLVAEICASVIETLPADVTAHEAVESLTEHVARTVGDVRPDHRPSCSVVIFSLKRRQLWRVGDCSAGYVVQGELQPWPGGKEIDLVTSNMRAAYLLAAQLTRQLDLSADPDADPGREIILPLLRTQYAFANIDPSLPFAFGVINGQPVPSAFIEVLDVPAAATEVVLCSDGYLEVSPTLTMSEDLLSRSLLEDPRRIGVYRSTKGITPGASSFDDRTYLRMQVPSFGGSE